MRVTNSRNTKTIKFTNNSVFDVVGAIESTLGGRRQGGIIDEIKNHDEELINTVVLPLLNIARFLPDGTVNPKEPNTQTICITSAWQKTTFSYTKLIDMFEKAIINPKNTFVMGCDFRVPALHGLIDMEYVNGLRMSPSYNEESFATEYLSLWRGGSDESWFSYDKLQKYRKIKNPETHARSRADSEQFYLLSIDVGRLHDQTVCCVFRVNVNGEGKFYATLVNLYVLGKDSQKKSFYQQAIDIKTIIYDFNPREVVMDTNGIGYGLAEEMTRAQLGADGTIYPPYGFFNDDDLKKIQPKDAATIFYGIKASGSLKAKIQSNTYTRLNSGMVRFLVKEQEAKSALLATAKGQKMTLEERKQRLIPHEMTTLLFNEMSNLRLKRTGANLDIVLEPINTRYPDDKYTAMSYGLWRIKELEDERSKRRKRSSIVSNRKLTFFTGGR